MRTTHFLCLASLAASAFAAPVQAAEVMSCIARYNTSSQMTGEAPGSLATSKNQPCRLSRNIAGVARGLPGGRAGGMDVVQGPANGKVQVESASSFVFTPKAGFSGSDSMLIRMKYGRGNTSGLVRFAISVN
jgi:hypothetical protein